MGLPAVPGHAEARGEFFGPGLDAAADDQGNQGLFDGLPAHGSGERLSLTPFAAIFPVWAMPGGLGTGDLW